MTVKNGSVVETKNMKMANGDMRQKLGLKWNDLSSSSGTTRKNGYIIPADAKKKMTADHLMNGHQIKLQNKQVTRTFSLDQDETQDGDDVDQNRGRNSIKRKSIKFDDDVMECHKVYNTCITMTNGSYDQNVASKLLPPVPSSNTSCDENDDYSRSTVVLMNGDDGDRDDYNHEAKVKLHHDVESGYGSHDRSSSSGVVLSPNSDMKKSKTSSSLKSSGFNGILKGIASRSSLKISRYHKNKRDGPFERCSVSDFY